MKIFSLFVLMISCTVGANLLLKLGATASDTATLGIVARLFSWRVLGALALLACAAVFYLIILGRLPLNVAQSFAAAQFIAVILAARVVLAEPISSSQWMGISLIALGIAFVGWTTE